MFFYLTLKMDYTKYHLIKQSDNILNKQEINEIVKSLKDNNIESLIIKKLCEYFYNFMQKVITQSFLIEQSKLGKQFIDYPIFLNEKSTNSEIKPNMDFSFVHFNFYKDISLYNNVRWSRGNYGIPKYHKVNIKNIIINFFCCFLDQRLGLDQDLYIEEFCDNAFNLINKHFNKPSEIYLKALNELINNKLNNNYQEFKIELRHNPYKNTISYDEDDGDCKVYFVRIHLVD